jgi:L-ascorbate metabolism protein UlaG (beta-lactamase superfamily)
MKITQIRNATLVIEYKNNYILVDPMLADQGAIPRFRYIGINRRNPLVELPTEFYALKEKINYGLITHCQKGHVDHLDRRGEKYFRERGIEVFSTAHDKVYLIDKGIKVHSFNEVVNPFFDGTIELVNARHATGFMSLLMEHGVGFFIKLPEEKSVYLVGDTILTDEIREFIKSNQPDYIVAPTGLAKFDIGSPLLLTERDIVELGHLSEGIIIANHMEALDHCRISRNDLKQILDKNGLTDKFLIPQDGETIKIT